MSLPARLVPLTGSQGLWPAQKPNFLALANSSLGDSGSPADGTDNLISSLFNAFSAAGSLLDGISTTGTVLDAAAAAANAIQLPDLDAAITAATQANDVNLNKIGAALGLLPAGGITAATLGPAPTPPSSAINCADQSTSTSNTSYLSGAETATGVTVAATSLLNSPSMALLMTATTAAEVGLMVTVIGAAVALTLLLVTFLGHGCGQACIDAAKAEQIYEASADNIAAVYKAGMITLAQAVAAMIHLLAAGQAHLATFGTQQARNGSANMTNVITAEIKGVQAEPKPKAVPFNINTARLDYIYGGNWYPDALQAASELTDQYLTALASAKG